MADHGVVKFYSENEIDIVPIKDILHFSPSKVVNEPYNVKRYDDNNHFRYSPAQLIMIGTKKELENNKIRHRIKKIRRSDLISSIKLKSKTKENSVKVKGMKKKNKKKANSDDGKFVLKTFLTSRKKFQLECTNSTKKKLKKSSNDNDIVEKNMYDEDEVSIEHLEEDNDSRKKIHLEGTNSTKKKFKKRSCNDNDGEKNMYDEDEVSIKDLEQDNDSRKKIHLEGTNSIKKKLKKRSCNDNDGEKNMYDEDEVNINEDPEQDNDSRKILNLEGTNTTKKKLKKRSCNDNDIEEKNVYEGDEFSFDEDPKQDNVSKKKFHLEGTNSTNFKSNKSSFNDNGFREENVFNEGEIIIDEDPEKEKDDGKVNDDNNGFINDSSDKDDPGNTKEHDIGNVYDNNYDDRADGGDDHNNQDNIQTSEDALRANIVQDSTTTIDTSRPLEPTVLIIDENATAPVHADNDTTHHGSGLTESTIIETPRSNRRLVKKLSVYRKIIPALNLDDDEELFYDNSLKSGVKEVDDEGKEMYKVEGDEIYIGNNKMIQIAFFEYMKQRCPWVFLRELLVIYWKEDDLMNRCFKIKKITTQLLNRSPRKLFTPCKYEVLRRVFEDYLDEKFGESSKAKKNILRQMNKHIGYKIRDLRKSRCEKVE